MFFYILHAKRLTCDSYANYNKLGITTNMKTRLSTLCTGAPFEIYKLFKFNCTLSQLEFIETMLLSITKKYRISDSAPREIRIGISPEELCNVTIEYLKTTNFEYEMLDFIPEEPKTTVLLDKHQVAVVGEILKLFQTNNSVWFSYPTGGGKTIICKNVLDALGLKLTVIVPSIELGNQYKRMFKKANCSVTYDRTYKNNIKDIDFNGLILFDEFHHVIDNTIKTLTSLPEFKNAKKLFCTATVKLAKNVEFYGSEVQYKVGIRELIDIKRLCEFEIRITYDDGKNNPISFCNKVCNTLQGKILIFCKNIEECESHYNNIKRDNMFIHHGGNSKYKPRSMLKEFKRQNSGILISCRTIVEGIDMPDVAACIITYNACDFTMVQIIGRIIRYQPNKYAVCVLLMNDIMERSAKELSRVMGVLNSGNIIYKEGVVKHYSSSSSGDKIDMIDSEDLNILKMVYVSPADIYKFCVKNELYDLKDYRLFIYTNNIKNIIDNPKQTFSKFEYPKKQ